MGLIRTAIVGAIGYFGYKKYKESQIDENGVAFAKGQMDRTVTPGPVLWVINPKVNGPRLTKNWMRASPLQIRQRITDTATFGSLIV